MLRGSFGPAQYLSDAASAEAVAMLRGLEFLEDIGCFEGSG